MEAIHSAGHEIASHGYGHELIYNQTPEVFRDDVSRSCDLLSSLTGSPISGYRAPSFSITDWSIDILAELGLTYDSSSFPTVGHDRYGKLSGADNDQPISQIRDGFFEVKVSSLAIGSTQIPWGGGGYFRAIPYPIYRAGLRRILRQKGQYVFYIHPWEIDAGQPRVNGIKPSYRFRHYLNLARCESRLEKLVRDFHWTTISQLLEKKPR